jgi:hypothetical protein
MNPFRSSNPNLSSSDRTRDKKSTYIYAAAKKKFQTKRPCNTKNIKYYKKGTVRSIANYKLQQDLARGNVLCEDCNNRGDLCGSINPSALIRVHMHNNSYSVYRGGSTLVPDISFNNPTISVTFTQSKAFHVINSDVSGVWGIASPPEVSKSDLSNAVIPNSDPSLNMPFGYINNLIDIPRNLDGSGIVIDPSNILFSDNACGIHSYFRTHTDIKTNIVLRGTLDLSLNISIPTGIPFEHKDNCKDPSYNNLIDSFVQIIIDPDFPGYTTVQGVLYGRITDVCCLNNFDGVPWMDIYIEIDNISDYDTLSYLINNNPQYRGSNWKTINPGGGGADYAGVFGPFKWGIPWVLVVYEKQINAARSVTVNGYFESMRIFQGTCENNQTTGNKVDQNYMSCLEDGTKKIKFT